MLNEPTKSALRKVDLSRKICNHLIGETHSPAHRYTAGGILIIFGVTISKVTYMFCAIPIVQATGDAIGYLIHAIGAIPIIEGALKKGKDESK